MQILPIHTRLIKAGDDLASILKESMMIHSGDSLVISSKAVATAEGAAIDLSEMTPTSDAELYAQKTGKSAAFCQAVLQETARMHGYVRGAVTGAMLTEVQTDDVSTVLIPNAGLDESNVSDGYAMGWPIDPVLSVQRISDALGIPVIISDSFIIPRRSGVSAFALVACGIDPVRSEVGTKDLFDHPLTITREAVADQFSVMANTVMGNAAQRNPAAIIRDHNIPRSDFCGWVPGVQLEEDLFQG